MTALRTTSATVSFSAPFMLKGRTEIYPAGSYEVETDEEIVEANGRTVYLRVATLLYIRSPGMARTLRIDPDDLHRALAADRLGQR